MSPFGTVLLACAALYAQAAVLYGWLWMYRSRRDDVGRGLLGTATGATLFSLGALFLTEPHAPLAAELGARLLYAGSFVAAGAFLAVASPVSGVRLPPRLMQGVLATMALGLVVSVLGLAHDPASVRPRMAHEPSLSLAGMVLLGAAVATMAFALLILARGATRRAGARWILLGAAPGGCGAVLEQVARLRGYQPVFVLTLSGTVLMLVASWVLLRRFAAVGDRLRTKQAALEASHAALVRAQRERARAEQLAGVGELSVVLAGEISRPMASLRESVAALDLAAIESGEARPILDEIDAETGHLNHLVSNLLVFARPSQEEPRAVSLAVLVEDAVRDVAAQRRAPVDAELEVDPSLEIACEPEAMRRAVAHVVENAVTAAEGEAILIRARRIPEGLVALDIADPGEGMDTVVRKRALVPFFTTRPYGTGLGLAIVARVVRAHGGSVEIESAHGRGTTVSLRLPLLGPDVGQVHQDR